LRLSTNLGRQCTVVRSCAIADSGSEGIRYSRAKSLPEPAGMQVSGQLLPCDRRPCAASLKVPSPPTAITASGLRDASRETSSMASSGREVIWTAYGMFSLARMGSILFHVSCPFPLPAAGLTMKTSVPFRCSRSTECSMAGQPPPLQYLVSSWISYRISLASCPISFYYQLAYTHRKELDEGDHSDTMGERS